MRSLLTAFLFSALIGSGGYSLPPPVLYATYSASSGAALDTGAVTTGNARSVLIQISNTGTALTGTITFIVNLNSGENYVIGTTAGVEFSGGVEDVTWGSSVAAVIGSMAAPTGVSRAIICSGLPPTIEIKIAAAVGAVPSIIIYSSSR